MKALTKIPASPKLCQCLSSGFKCDTTSPIHMCIVLPMWSATQLSETQVLSEEHRPPPDTHKAAINKLQNRLSFPNWSLCS
ncbi:hypothetical protein VNO80_24328 [Phaseolus coccineus]|uniref:Uncharacterized protein n=1 Tax=Phaseolus coccineus TaxID=3886 RepID=A0AAN9LSP3_PHACN